MVMIPFRYDLPTAYVNAYDDDYSVMTQQWADFAEGEGHDVTLTDYSGPYTIDGHHAGRVVVDGRPVDLRINYDYEVLVPIAADRGDHRVLRTDMESLARGS